MEPIDLNAWGRKELYTFFSGMSQPFYSVSFTVDVTDVYRYVKPRGLSFYYALVYLCTQAVNEVDAFQYVIQGQTVFHIPRRIPSFTDLKPGSDTFHIVTLPAGEDLDAFCTAARAKSRAQTSFLDQASETADLIYFTCLPWVELTAMTNERDFDPDDSVPRIGWGRYREENGRKTLQISMELNHRLTDGVHVGRFYEALCCGIQALSSPA